MGRGAIAVVALLGGCRMGFEPHVGDTDGAIPVVDASTTDASTTDASAIDASAIDASAIDAGPCVAAPGCTAFTCSGSCFQTCPMLLSFGDAETACVAWGGCLATIDSAAKAACVTGLADESWIGLQQIGGAEPAGGWEWVCGGAVAYTNWMLAEPNDGGNEDCGEVKDLATGGWNDENCSFSRAYVCERP